MSFRLRWSDEVGEPMLRCPCPRTPLFATASRRKEATVLALAPSAAMLGIDVYAVRVEASSPVRKRGDPET